jgi:hypothetical protein
MAKFNVESLLEDIKNNAISSVKTDVKDFLSETETDIKEFIVSQKNNIIKYAELLENKEINQDEFNDLMLGLKDLCQMKALEEKGIAIAKLDKIKSDIMDSIINTIISKV